MKPVNPYIVGNPIKDQASFFGRQDIFREVMQVLRQRESNAIVLYGQRRIGKTSVLLQLEKQLSRDGEFTPVYFDLQDKASKSLPDVLFELSQHISRVTGHTTAKAADFDRTGDYFRSAFLPEITEKVASGGLVLLFDEFDVLDSPLRTQASEAFFPYLRQWMADVHKVKFVFVIGRRPEDLSVRTMSTFKGIQSTRVSFLSEQDARDVILQSEQEGTLKWENDAVDCVLGLTHGHPYFTQLLCSVLWENAYENSADRVPSITAQSVEKGVLPALKFGANAFNWLWDGLPPAERVVVAAMAEVKDETITQDKLIETLNLSGVRLVARELEVAPETLIDWEVLIASDHNNYHFAVPLLRRWVLTNRPLRRVKDELDRLNPLADGLYQTGYGYYDRENPDLDAATQQLQQALNINPNHLKARLLLGQILLEKGNIVESVKMFDAAYQYDERAARADLIKSLLALAETQDENLQLSTYERILKIQGDQAMANEKIRAIWIKRGEAAQSQGNYEEALKIFEQIGDSERSAKIRALMHEKKLALDMQRADAYEKAGQWKFALDTLAELIPEYPQSEMLQSRMQTAKMHWRNECLRTLDSCEQEENWSKMLELCEGLEKDFPDDLDIRSRSDHARVQISAAQKYQEALNAIQSGQTDQAKQMLSQVLVENPKHLQAAIMLIESTYGKVNILSRIPAGVYFIASVITVVWTLVVLFATNGLVAEWFENQAMEMYAADRFVFRETFIILSVILTPLIGVLLSYHMNNVIGVAYRVKRDKLSFGKALLTHFVFGMGLFYVDRESRRKWLYPLVALSIALMVFTWLFYQLTMSMVVGNFGFRTMAEGRIEDAAKTALWIFLILYALSCVDVVVTCYVQRRNYRFTRREHLSTPAEVKSIYPRRIVQLDSISTQSGRLASTTKLTIERLVRWLRSRTRLQLFGIITLIIVLVAAFGLSDTLGESPWYLIYLFIALLLTGLIMYGFIVLLVLIIKNTILWLVARLRKSSKISAEKELDSTTDITK